MREATIETGGDGYTSTYYPGQTLQVEKPNSLPKALFAGIKSLQRILLPSQLVEIGDGAFRASGLTYIQLPESVTTVGEYAFAECTSLSKAKLHAKLSNVAKGLFEGCTALTTVQNSKITEVGTMPSGDVKPSSSPFQAEQLVSATTHSKDVKASKSLTLPILSPTLATTLSMAVARFR